MHVMKRARGTQVFVPFS